jgi:hypothetical protein
MSNDVVLESPKPDAVLALEKTRLEHCITLTDREAKRQQALETKAQFYLTFVTVFLGAIFLNLEFATSLDTLISAPNTPAYLRSAVLIDLSFIAVLILIALIGIFESIRVKDYKEAYKSDLTLELFGYDLENTKPQRVEILVKDIAIAYSLALEHNKEINDSKAFWLKITSYCILAITLSVAVLLAMTSYVQFL